MAFPFGHDHSSTLTASKLKPNTIVIDDLDEQPADRAIRSRNTLLVGELNPMPRACWLKPLPLSQQICWLHYTYGFMLEHFNIK